ncbi:unannotated protein [freshwater metagenome]|uniref:Unannotated protein n=1 Tax=freshwater metagenome TaxID=449393 RepID=A0A6J6KRV9_9ZZZZ
MHISPTASSTEKHGVSPEKTQNPHRCPLPIHSPIALHSRGSRYVVAGDRMGGDVRIELGTLPFQDLVARSTSVLHKVFLEGR